MIILFISETHDEWAKNKGDLPKTKCLSCCGHDAKMLLKLKYIVDNIEPQNKKDLQVVYNEVKSLLCEWYIKQSGLRI